MRVPFSPLWALECVNLVGLSRRKKNETQEVRQSLSSSEGLGEKILSNEHIGLLVNAALVVPMVVSLPLLDLIGPPCARFLQRRRNQKRSEKVTVSVKLPNSLAE